MKWRALIFLLAIPAFCLGFGDGVREQSLREAAQGSGMLIGTAVRPAHLSESAYASTLAREFNMLEPEDVLKWEVVHPSSSLSIFLKETRLSISRPGTD
jgi:GH35 family endo-1,4-beta-xylanase